LARSAAQETSAADGTIENDEARPLPHFDTDGWLVLSQEVNRLKNKKFAAKVIGVANALPIPDAAASG
jgi:hypothetical protein